MGLYLIKPTAFQSADATLGGLAVTSPSNDGHASTTALAFGDEVGAPVRHSCRWHSFPSFPSFNIKSKKLKVTHSSSGSLVGASPSNFFQLAYSLNGGSSWTNVVTRVDFTSSQNDTLSVDLAVGQDLTQVQVRDHIEASAFNIGDSASSTVTISDIKVEVIIVDPLLVMM